MNVNKKVKKCLLIGMCTIVCGTLIFKLITKDKTNQNANANVAINSKVENGEEINDEIDSIKISIDTSQFIYDQSRDLYKVTKKVDKVNGKVEGEIENISSFTYSVTDEKGIIVKDGLVEGIEEWSISDVGFVLGKNKLTLTAETSEGKSTSSITVYNESYDNVNNLSVDNSDTDNDGLINYWEDYFGTDKNKNDSDGDGVSDKDEITHLGTNPSKPDTNENGTNDGDDDFDKDGLTNKEEIKYGTNPYLADTDGDLLSDYDEIYKYKTNPLAADTDGDGAKDGWEVANNYNPLAKDEHFTLTATSNDKKAKLYSNTIKGCDVENFNISLSKEVYIQTVAGAKTKIYELGYNSEAQISIEYSAKSEEEKPLIYEYNPETQKLEALITSVNDTYLSAKTSGKKNTLYIVIDQVEYDASIAPPVEDDDDDDNEIVDGADSNNDGITDRDTLDMCNGKILTCAGTKVFGDAAYEEIQANNDYDKDNIINGDEIIIEEDEDGTKYVILKSSPAAYDTDNDGINDFDDTAPFTRGLKDGIIGTVQIYSRHNPDEAFFLGHAFLVYTSYVNDENIVIKDINRGYLFNKEKDTYVLKEDNQDLHTLQRGEYVSIGNYRSQGLDVVYDSVMGDYEALWIDSGLSEHLDKDNLTITDLLFFGLSGKAEELLDKNIQGLNGPSIRFNEEIYATYAYEGFIQYPNAVLKKEVTQEQLNKMTKFVENNNYYNLLTNNCSSIATGAWNSAFNDKNDKLFSREKSGMYSIFDTPMILKKNMNQREGVETDVKTFGIPLK